MPAVSAAPAPAQSLSERLDRALVAPGVSRARTGAFVVELSTGRTVYGLNRNRSLAPASNQKLAVALSALDRLGPGYRIQTAVFGHGRRVGTTWRGRLVLKGYGDPTLTGTDVRTLARAVRNQGITRVTGRIFGDETYYDKRRVGPGWRSSWYKIESPPLSALVVSRAKVDGRTVDNPARAAVRRFRDALRATGVRVLGGITVAKAPRGSVFLTRIRSAGLATLVRRMNKRSDNFFAEMLVKHLGARFRDDGTTAKGAAVMRRVLARRGVPLDGVRLADGSGLSLHNRLTARALARLLASAWADPELRSPLVASLPVAGVDGTLSDRMRSRPARGRIRAKTGTTMNASALSGYAGSRYVFSILQNGRRIPWESARRSQDRFGQALARAL